MNVHALPAVLKVAVPLLAGAAFVGAIALGATGGSNGGAPAPELAAAQTPTPTRAPETSSNATIGDT